MKVLIEFFTETKKYSKAILYILFTKSVCDVALSFIPIYYSAKIIEILINSININRFLIYSFLFILSLYILNFFSSILTEKIDIEYNKIITKEKYFISSNLLNIKIEDYEKLKLQKKINAYRESVNQNGSSFISMLSNTTNFFTSLLIIMISGYQLRSIFFISFSNKNGLFFESNLFLISIVTITVTLIALIIYITIKENKKATKLSKKYYRLSYLFNYYFDILKNTRNGKEIRIFNLKDLIEKNATADLLIEGEMIQKQIGNLTAQTGSVIAIISAIISGGLYVFIGIKGYLNYFDINYLVRYLGCISQLISGSVILIDSIGRFHQILLNLKYYFELVNYWKKTNENIKNEKINLQDKKSHTIEFKNVFFKYANSNNYALENISILIESNKSYAIVGENGSGKSTFIKLLARIYTISSGDILLDGISIYNYDYYEYQKIFSIIFQDFNLLSGKLGNNISSSLNVDYDLAIDTLSKIGGENLLKRLNYNLETELYNERSIEGVELSSGEAQLIALARTLYNNRIFYIFDEPTASMDTYKEKNIYNRINSLTSNKGVIYISHRLSSCLLADNVIVFDDKKIVQNGTHDELIKNTNGKYYELYNNQAKYYVNF